MPAARKLILLFRPALITNTNGVINMKKIIVAIIAAALILSLAACAAEAKTPVIITTLPSDVPSAPAPAETTDMTSPPPETLSPEISDEPTDGSTPTPDPSPMPEVSVIEEPGHLGSGDTLFDVYVTDASADLDGDGTDEQIQFEAGASKSTVSINGTAHLINVSGPAQLFAITDVDKNDNYLELVFTDKYNSGLADTEFAYSYVYWWDGTKLTSMGSLMDVKFSGAWRDDFKATKYFKADGFVYCLAHTTQLTDIWYMERLKPDGTGRKFKEDFSDYTASPVNTPEPLTIKAGKKCLLLAHGTSKFFGNSNMWDYSKYPHNAGRLINPTDDIVIIAQSGETLTVYKVLGPNWVILKTSDGKKGYIKLVEGKVLGYNLAAADIFDGIVVAG